MQDAIFNKKTKVFYLTVRGTPNTELRSALQSVSLSQIGSSSDPLQHSDTHPPQSKQQKYRCITQRSVRLIYNYRRVRMSAWTDLPSVRTVIKIKNYTNHFSLNPVIWQSARGMCSAALSLPLIQRLCTKLYKMMQASVFYLSGRSVHWRTTFIFSSQMLMIKGGKKRHVTLN